MHRLFVAISGVADQLQTNHAKDLRVILKHVFTVCLSEPEEDEVSSQSSSAGSDKIEGEDDQQFMVQSTTPLSHAEGEHINHIQTHKPHEFQPNIVTVRFVYS